MKRDYIVLVDNPDGTRASSVFGDAASAIAFAAELTGQGEGKGGASTLELSPALVIGPETVTYRGEGFVCEVRPLAPLEAARRQGGPVETVPLDFNRWGQSSQVYARDGRLAVVGMTRDGRFAVMAYDRREVAHGRAPEVLTMYDTAREAAAWLKAEGWGVRE